MPDEPNEFEDSFKAFNRTEEMIFLRNILLDQAQELHECYNYIFDTNKHLQSEELTNILEWVRLSKVGLEQSYQYLDNQLFEESDVDFVWKPDNK